MKKTESLSSFEGRVMQIWRESHTRGEGEWEGVQDEESLECCLLGLGTHFSAAASNHPAEHLAVCQCVSACHS